MEIHTTETIRERFNNARTSADTLSALEIAKQKVAEFPALFALIMSEMKEAIGRTFCHGNPSLPRLQTMLTEAKINTQFLVQLGFVNNI